MTSLSALPALNTSVAGNPTATSRAATSAANGAAQTPTSSATIVTLGQANAALSAQLYTPPAAPAPVWERATGDAVSTLMASNNTATSLATRFKGLGAALLGRFDTEAGNFSQSVVQFAPATQMGNILETMTQAQLHKLPDNQIALTVQTVGGAQVQLTLGSTDNGLAVQVDVTKGTLTDADRNALSKLAGGFQKAIDGLAASPPRMDLNGLTQFDSTVLSSVDLHASVQAGGGPQVIDFHADDKQRTVSSSGPLGSMKLAVDLSNPAIVGNAKQQAQAISRYLKQFDYEQDRGHGDATMMGMFKDAFSQMNSNYPASASQQNFAAPGAISLNAEDHSLLTGLADFSASVSQNSTFPNPLHAEESDAFSYQLSQTSSVKGDGQLNRTITQQQQSHLSASYHESLQADLPLRLTTARESQNYTYHQIEDSASSTASISYGRGALVRATLSQSASQSSRVMKYVMGALQSDVTTPLQASWTKDLLAQFQKAQSGDNSRTTLDNFRWQQTLESINSLTVLQADPTQIKADDVKTF